MIKNIRIADRIMATILILAIAALFLAGKINGPAAAVLIVLALFFLLSCALSSSSLFSGSRVPPAGTSIRSSPRLCLTMR